MTTIALLRTTYLNVYLKRADADTEPWTTTDCDRHLTDALMGLWPDVGARASGTVQTSSATNEYTLPAGVLRVSRIDLTDASGVYIDRVSNWRYKDGTTLVIRPRLADGYTLVVGGWAPYDPAASDLPAPLEQPVAMLAAGLAYGELAGSLVNLRRQQGLDTGRVVDYNAAGSLSAYWDRRASQRLSRLPYQTGFGARWARR